MDIKLINSTGDLYINDKNDLEFFTESEKDFEIIQNIVTMLNIRAGELVYDINYGLIYVNNKTNYNLYQKYYGSRYYIGVNFITTLSFANIFWNRMHTFKNLTRPHEWEISKYDANLECITMIPNIEIQCAIDDNHGEKGTCLLERKEDKFWNIYNAL